MINCQAVSAQVERRCHAYGLHRKARGQYRILIEAAVSELILLIICIVYPVHQKGPLDTSTNCHVTV